ncbi:zinc finger protein 678-like isoform X2 [Anthonomus grandis grandis]|uniref:zinc finger protein 678-like isoform X2 n=1 Tax=Anthonomus grandis grandis TaxID=2921223 RepID=UPI00216589A9|nr:zinc finger protein 678-like isoform X2 [Anthonomus grandis grandis]
MFDPNVITTTTQQTAQIQYQQQQPQQQQQQQQQNDKDKNNQEQKQQEFTPFCYATNVNMIQKIAPQTQHSTVNMSQLTDDKCYITQPAFSYNYTLVSNVNQNLLTQNAISNITFKCDVCGLMFAHLSLLNHHKKVHHGQTDQQQAQQQQITVQLMPTQVPQAQQPTQIQIVSADRIRFSCEECGMTFATQGELKTHKIQNHQQGQQQVQAQSQQTTQQVTVNTLKIKNCETCGAPLPQDTNKKRAVMKVKCETCLSAEAIQPQIFVVAAAPEPQIKFEESTGTQTQNPNATLGTQNSIPIGQVKTIHQTTNNHPVKKRGVASVTKCTKCNGSGIIFIGGTKNPQTNVDKPFHCNICNGSFSRYSSLWSHKRLHSGEKNFKCNICGLAFAKAAYLKNHSRIHTGEKPYRCNVCGMQFSQSPHLKNHERIHSGERPYVCEVCDKSFARHSTLWNHRRIHTGEKPYRCDICSSCFNQATHLKNHQKVHSGEKPFKCDICSVGFSDRFALKRHRNIHEKYGRTKPMNQINEEQTNNGNVDSSTDAALQVHPEDSEGEELLEAKIEGQYDESEEIEEEMEDISDLQCTP